MGAGLLIACRFFIFGELAHKFLGVPSPVLMIVAVSLVKCLQLNRILVIEEIDRCF
jgi:malate:Na+ symporter